MLLLYILWDDWPMFMISGSNEQLQQELEYTLLKPDWHSWWISKMQSGREDTLEERYAIKFCFKVGENVTEMYGMLQTAFGASCMNQASDGNEYVINLIDDDSGRTMLYFLKHKSNTLLATKKYLTDIAPYGHVKCIRTDNGMELNLFNDYLYLIESNMSS